MSIYDEARNAGATHEQAKKIEVLAFDRMLCRNGGLHAENAGVPYHVWRKVCNK